MKQESKVSFNHVVFINDGTENFALTHAIRQSADSVYLRSIERQPGATHDSWEAAIREVVEINGRAFHVEGALRITEATSDQEAMEWRIALDVYWESLYAEPERKESHGGE